jgi:hypothetical protein
MSRQINDDSFLYVFKVFFHGVVLAGRHYKARVKHRYNNTRRDRRYKHNNHNITC